MATSITITIGAMGKRAETYAFQAPVKVSEVLAAANLTNEAAGKKLMCRIGGREEQVTPDSTLNCDAFILITKDVKGA